MTDRTQRMAVAALALITLACIIGIIVLAAMEDTLPDSLVAIGSAGAGALAAIFTSRAASGQPAMPPAQWTPPPGFKEWAEAGFPPLETSGPQPAASPSTYYAPSQPPPTEPTPTADYGYRPEPWEQSGPH